MAGRIVYDARIVRQFRLADFRLPTYCSPHKNGQVNKVQDEKAAQFTLKHDMECAKQKLKSKKVLAVMKVRMACVGVGYWGKNLLRVFYNLPDASVEWIGEPDSSKHENFKKQYPDVELVTDYGGVLTNPDIEAVVLAVPAIQHFSMARAALEAGKHVYVEKPMTLTGRDAEELVGLAEAKGLTLMVGHLLKYHPAVEMLKQMIEDESLGDLYYLYSQRVNLGIVRKDENALWSLAPHDISVILYLLEQQPVSVSVHGECYLQPGIADTVFVNMHFENRQMAQLHLSWLDPQKIRRLTIVGSKKMAVFDDMESTEKIRIYDKAAERSEYESYGEAITLRFGDVLIPHIDMVEPLKVECQHFLNCVLTGERPKSDGVDGYRVVRVLEAAQRSLDQGGKPVALGG
jgi:predicted dehydrogenase